MKIDDLMYGSHSGIQKAIRRGDLDLAKTCFDLMWSEKQHRSWLQWRFVILVEEEMWWMLGEASKFLKEKESKSPDDWKKFIYKLCLLPKSKDTESLFELSRKGDFDHKEMEEMLFWKGVLDETGMASASDELMQDIRDGRYGDKSEYELNAVRISKHRANSGGMAGDKTACFATMLLIAMRGLKQDDVEDYISDSLKKKKIARQPRTVELPWYVFDMHTTIGKMAMSIFMKHHAEKFDIDKDGLDGLWFCLESAKIPPEDLPLVKYSDDAKPTAFESMWWPLAVRDEIQFADNSAKQAKALWDSKIGTEIQSIVNWCIEKRS